MDWFWEGVEHYPSNDLKNDYFQDYAKGIVERLEERKEAAELGISFTEYQMQFMVPSTPDPRKGED